MTNLLVSKLFDCGIVFSCHKMIEARTILYMRLMRLSQTTYHLGLKLYTRIYVLFGKGKIQLSHNWINICYTKLIFEKYFYYDFKLPKVLLLTLQAESVFLSFMYPYHKTFLKLFTPRTSWGNTKQIPDKVFLNFIGMKEWQGKEISKPFSNRGFCVAVIGSEPKSRCISPPCLVYVE